MKQEPQIKNRTSKQKQDYLSRIIIEQTHGEFKGFFINRTQSLIEVPRGYTGLVLEIADNEKITLWRVFKNGAYHEIASRIYRDPS